MYLFTGNQCLICYKECGDNKSEQPEGTTTTQSVQTFLNKNAEICRRFCTLATRYLDLDPYFYNPLTTINSKRTVCCERACRECTEMLSQFCELYQQIEYLQMQLSWRTHEIAQVMKNADNQDGEHATYRKALEEKFIKIGSNIEDIDDFRKEFIESIDTKRKESFPTLKLESGKSDEDDYPDFEVVTVKKGEKRKPDSDENAIEPPEETTKELSSTRMQVDKANKNSTSTSSSISASNKYHETDSQEKLTKVSKRPKISLKSNKSSTTTNETVSVSKVTEEEGFNLDISDGIDDDPAKDSNSSNLSDNTVIILSNETKNLEIISEDFSSQYQDDVLCRVGGTISDDKLLAWKSNEWEGHGDIPGVPSGVKVGMSTLSNESLLTNGYYKQFDYLQYKCPFPDCGKMFNTMTRITVHQQATGHNINAIITITSK